MFKDIYKAANDSIKGDPKLLSKILSQADEEKVKKFTPRRYHYIATSLAAVFIVCLSLFVFPEYSRQAAEENMKPSVTVKDDAVKQLENAKMEPAAKEKKETENETGFMGNESSGQNAEIFSYNKAISTEDKAIEKAPVDAPPETSAQNESESENEAVIHDTEQALSDFSAPAPMIAEATEEIAPAYGGSSDEEIPQQKSFARASSGGSGGGSSAKQNTACSLFNLPEEFHESVNTGSEIIYESADGTAKITSTLYTEGPAPEPNTETGGISVYREGNAFVFQKSGVAYSITFENISEDEIINIISNNF